jgi:hypothetical protein
MFEKILGMFKPAESTEASDQAGNELIRLLAQELAFMTPEEKSKLATGEKLEASADVAKRYGEALALIETNGLSPEIKNELENIVKSVEEAYVIG